MKIAISAGHNVINNNIFDPGAVGNGKREADITKATVKELKPLLEDMGHKVYDVTPYDQHFKNSKEAHRFRANKVNELGVDFYIDVHINSFNDPNANGAEVLLNAKNTVAYKYARKILNNITKDLEIRERGLMNKPGFWSISMVKCPAIIVEGGFITNKSDIDKLTPKDYAKAIAKAFGEVKEVEKVEDKEIGIYVDGKEQKVRSINLKGHNYVNIRDLAKVLGFEISNKGKTPIISPKVEFMAVNGEDKAIETIKLNGDTNFVKIRNLEELIDVKYENKKVHLGGK